MGKLAVEAEKYIQKIKNNNIRIFLLESLNKDAEEIEFLFCSQSVMANNTPKNIDFKSYLSFDTIVNYAFAFSPAQVGIELSKLLLELPIDETILLLKEGISFALCFSPTEVQERLVNWIASLTSSQLEQLLGDIALRDIITNERNIGLLQALQNLRPEIILNYFHRANWYFDTPFLFFRGYTGHDQLIEIFSDKRTKRTPDIAIELLNLVENLSYKDLLMLFKGKAVDQEQLEYHNFLHVLFRNHEARIIKKALQLTERFTDKDLSDLLSNRVRYKSSRDYTALSRALMRNELEIAHTVIDFLQSRPSLKKLLICPLIEILQFDLCKKRSPDIAIELLNLVENLSYDDLLMLFKGKVVDQEQLEHLNLLHVLFCNHEARTIKKALQLTERFTDKDLRDLLYKFVRDENTGDYYTALSHVSMRNELEITHTVIDFLQSRPSLKDLLVSPLYRITERKVLIQFTATPFQLAIAYGNTEVVAYCLEQKRLEQESWKYFCDFSLKATQQSMPNSIHMLHTAFPIYKAIYDKLNPQKSIEALIPLIKKNPQLLATRWSNQRTVLHHAANLGKAPSIYLLIMLGADINAKDRYGKLPLDYAQASNQSSIVQALLSGNRVENDEIKGMIGMRLVALALGQFELNTFVNYIVPLRCSHWFSHPHSDIGALSLANIPCTTKGFQSLIILLNQTPSSSLLPHLEALDLQGCGIGDNEITELAPILSSLKLLTSLNLDNNFLIRQHVLILLNGIYGSSQHPPLKTLFLKFNRIEISDITQLLGIQAKIPSNAALEHIDVTGNLIGEKIFYKIIEQKTLSDLLVLFFNLLMAYEQPLTINLFLLASYKNIESKDNIKLIELEIENLNGKRCVQLPFSEEQFENYDYFCTKNAAFRANNHAEVFTYLKSGLDESPMDFNCPLPIDPKERKRQVKKLFGYHSATSLKGIFSRNTLFSSQPINNVPSLFFPQQKLTQQKGYFYLFANISVTNQHTHLGYEFLTSTGQRVIKIAHFTKEEVLCGNCFPTLFSRKSEIEKFKISFKTEGNDLTKLIQSHLTYYHIAQFSVAVANLNAMDYEIMQEEKEGVTGKYQWLITQKTERQKVANCLTWCLDKMERYLKINIKPPDGLYITSEIVKTLIENPASILIQEEDSDTLIMTV